MITRSPTSIIENHIDMSTHFRPRPRPPPTPTSPVRPSTAHSTIRAVTPSPPGSGHDTFKPTFPLPRPKSEHALGSLEMATYARYVMQAENGEFDGSRGLRTGGATSGRSSPVKSRSKSPRKRPISTPLGLSAYAVAPTKAKVHKESDAVEDEQKEADQDQQELAIEEQELPTEPGPIVEEEPQDSDSDASAPDTPTPMTRAQKCQAYTPLRLPTATTTPINDLSFLPPGPPALSPVAPPKLSPIPRKPIALTNVQNRMSVSGASHTTFLSTASKNSIFSTPGRDELERKKALVEIDEGPFARVQSMMDLDEERRRISGGDVVEDGKANGKKRGRLDWCGCMVM